MAHTDLLNRLQTVFPNASVGGDFNLDAAGLEPGESALAKLERALVAPDTTPRARGPVPSLDSWTLKPETNGFVELKVTDFGGGYSEATAMVRPVDYRRPRQGKKGTVNGPRDRSEMTDGNRLRSSQRSKKMVRHKVKAMGADRIVTLTSRGYLKTPDLVWQAMQVFNSCVRKELGDKWSYVAVPEMHKNREHWHVHLAVSGHYSAVQLRRLWHLTLRKVFIDAVYDASPGNIDISYKAHTHAARLNAIARYISKYITKAHDDGFMHRRRYSHSLNIPRPHIHKWYLDLNSLHDLAIIRKIQECCQGALSRSPVWEVYGGFDCLIAETEPLPT